MSSDNTQLPAEVVAKIENTAKSRLIKSGNTSFNRGYYSGEISGATEYATKLHEAEDKIVALQRKVEKLSEENYDISGQMGSLENSTIRQTEAFCEAISWGETARTLLEKVATRHEAGLLPDPLLYTEINSFLNGTK